MHLQLVAMFCLLLGCQPRPPVPVPPQPVPDETATCASACETLTRLDCPAGRTTPDGHTCLEVCRSWQDSGIAMRNLGCVTQAVSCPKADACQ
jgi:hypothetical protein